jgi:hypothetical protein
VPIGRVEDGVVGDIASRGVRKIRPNGTVVQDPRAFFRRLVACEPGAGAEGHLWELGQSNKRQRRERDLLRWPLHPA